MKKETEVIRKAKIKNGRDFEMWLEAPSSNVPNIEKVREITRKVPYSMVDEASK